MFSGPKEEKKKDETPAAGVIVQVPAGSEVKLVENGKVLKYVKNKDGKVEAQPTDKPEPVYIQPDPSKTDILVVQVSEVQHGDLIILGIAQKQQDGTAGPVTPLPNGDEKRLIIVAGTGLDRENNGIDAETIKKELQETKKLIFGKDKGVDDHAVGADKSSDISDPNRYHFADANFDNKVPSLPAAAKGTPMKKLGDAPTV